MDHFCRRQQDNTGNSWHRRGQPATTVDYQPPHETTMYHRDPTGAIVDHWAPPESTMRHLWVTMSFCENFQRFLVHYLWIFSGILH